MCGRYMHLSSGPAMASWFGLDDEPLVTARYNIAPSQPVPVVRLAEAGSRRECAFVRWGLVPSWAKDGAFNASTINARAETLLEKPAFRTPFRRRRCLVPADGFYEWKATGQRLKQPYAIRPADGNPIAFAGLWDRWQSPQGETIESMTIITTSACEMLRPLHERMPVILPPERYAFWLDPQSKMEDLSALLLPYPESLLRLTAVSSYVSSPRHEGPRCLEAEKSLFV